MEGKIKLLKYNVNIGFVSTDLFDDISDIEGNVNNSTKDSGKSKEKTQILDANSHIQRSETLLNLN
jgi:hypothetical protein